MNKARRKRLEQAIQILNEVREEEEQALLAMPESLQEAPQGERMQETVEYLDEAIQSAETALENSQP